MATWASGRKFLICDLGLECCSLCHYAAPLYKTPRCTSKPWALSAEETLKASSLGCVSKGKFLCSVELKQWYTLFHCGGLRMTQRLVLWCNNNFSEDCSGTWKWTRALQKHCFLTPVLLCSWWQSTAGIQGLHPTLSILYSMSAGSLRLCQSNLM